MMSARAVRAARFASSATAVALPMVRWASPSIRCAFVASSSSARLALICAAALMSEAAIRAAA